MILLAALLLLALISLLYLWQSWQLILGLNHLQSAQTQLEALKTESGQLRFQVGQAFSLERIGQIARQQLHMTRSSPQYMKLLPISPSP